MSNKKKPQIDMHHMRKLYPRIGSRIKKTKEELAEGNAH